MSNEWVLGILLAAILALGGFAKTFIVAFVESKAKDLATKKDFDKLLDETRRLTTETEQIKSRISYDLWDRQARFQMKREIYVPILELVGSIQRCVARQAILERSIDSAPDKESVKAEIRALRSKVAEIRDQYTRASFVVPLVCSAQSVVAMSDVDSALSHLTAPPASSARIEKIDRLSLALDKLIRCAKNDLGFAPSAVLDRPAR